MDSKELEELVSKLRSLGVKEYKTAELHIVLSDARPPEATEKSLDEQQRLRDEREKQFLERKRRTLLAASWGIGPPRSPIK